MPYRAPVAQFQFLLDHVVGYRAVTGTERFAEADGMTGAVLGEAARLCEDVLAPLQRVGDTDPVRLENGVVRTPEGFGAGYRAIAEGGWIGLAADPAWGGQGLPQTLATCVNDMMSSACLALQISPLMTQGQIDALEHHASDDIRALYLPQLNSGEWSATMNLTEPQAGSDVGALGAKAEPAGDGTYRITGQKIYISWADNDFTENVCHLVLARLPDAPKGTKGISLFLVPKHIPDDHGRPGVANALKVVSLEHKLGLHGSPTAVMQYDGAKGWMIGPEQGGMAAMFTMMNNARLGVGVQGIGVAEAATQAALDYAMGRKQGRVGGSGTIVEHADVRRMLAMMRAETVAARGIALSCAVAIDMARATGEGAWAARAAFLTPIVKAWGTEIGIRVADEGIQVHGGMGYVEETGAAQYLRDVRVTAIYEGTNGIQAMDLVGRKLADGGAAAFALVDEIQRAAENARTAREAEAEAVWSAAETLRETTEWLVGQDRSDREAGAMPYLHLWARVLGAHMLLGAALADGACYGGLSTLYIKRLLPAHGGLAEAVRAGAADLFDLAPGDLAAA